MKYLIILFLLIQPGCQNRYKKLISHDGEGPLIFYKKDKKGEIPVFGHKAKLAYVIDGDTQIYWIDGAKVRVRLLHINCPEMTSKLGLEAKQYVIDLDYQNCILLHKNKLDKYGRLLAEIELENGDVLNKLLVKEGLAVHYKKYSSDKEYSDLEDFSRLNNKGLWKL